MSVLSVFVFGFIGSAQVLAQKDNEPTKAKHFAPVFEEAVENGEFDVEGQPDLKVKVFVHKEKARPGEGDPVLICSEDLDSYATTGPAGWRLPSSIVYTLNPSSVPSSVGSSNLTLIADKSFTAWTSSFASGSPVSITKSSLNTAVTRAVRDGKNIVAWGNASASALGVTYIWYNTLTKVVVEVDTIMNKKFAWMWNGGTSMCANSNIYDAQNIMTHEFGHWLGLNDHYTLDYANNTMYGYGSKGEVKKDTLTSGDIVGMRTVYR